MNILPAQVISFSLLRSQGVSEKKITDMAKNLHLFPTPFKGIYYVPTDDERNGWLIQNPARALRTALRIYLGTDRFYYSCVTAEEFHGIDWHVSGELHVVNTVRSGRVDIQARIERNRKKKTWRAKQVARILEFYGRMIVFHKAPSIEGAKMKRTPDGDFALPSQIKKDRKRFRERALRPEYIGKLKRIEKEKPMHFRTVAELRKHLESQRD